MPERSQPPYTFNQPPATNTTTRSKHNSMAIEVGAFKGKICYDYFQKAKGVKRAKNWNWKTYWKIAYNSLNSISQKFLWQN